MVDFKVYVLHGLSTTYIHVLASGRSVRASRETLGIVLFFI